MEIDHKKLPHDHKAEQGVLGSILLESDGINEGRFLDICIQRGLVADSFHDPRNFEVFRAMRNLDAAQKPVNDVTVLKALRDNGRLEAIGGEKYIEALVNATPTAAHAEYHLQLVIEAHRRRQIIRASEQAINDCMNDESRDIEFLRSRAEMALLDIGTTENAMVPWSSLVDQTASELDEVSRRDKPVLEGLSTGLRDLDAKMLGMRPGELIVIAACPSVGKTSLAMNIAENVALANEPVLVFSLEMPARALSKRMMAGRAKVNLRTLNRCLYHNSQLEGVRQNIDKAKKDLRGVPLYVDDTSGLEIAELFSRARRLVKQKGVKLIVVDYLQLCCCREAAKQGGNYAETTAISMRLKAMAKSLRVPVIALSQLSREVEKREDKKPRLSDLRGSGAIEQDADIVLLLRREQKDKHLDREEAIADVAKNRNGETGDVKVAFEPAYTRFSNLS